jgi:hypothetical protein
MLAVFSQFVGLLAVSAPFSTGEGFRKTQKYITIRPAAKWANSLPGYTHVMRYIGALFPRYSVTIGQFKKG